MSAKGILVFECIIWVKGVEMVVFVSETNPLDLIGSLAKGVDLLV